MGVTVDFEGLDGLQGFAQAALDAITNKLAQNLEDELGVIQQEAFELTPFDPNNQHAGHDSSLKVVGPRRHTGLSIQPAEIHQHEKGQDTGHLRDTSVVDVLTRDDLIYGQISYNSEYAVYQHEGMEFNHPNGGMAKFLEEPFLGHAADMLETLGEGVGE